MTSAVMRLINRWREEAEMGLNSGEPDAYDRGGVYQECADELQDLVATPLSKELEDTKTLLVECRQQFVTMQRGLLDRIATLESQLLAP